MSTPVWRVALAGLGAKSRRGVYDKRDQLKKLAKETSPVRTNVKAARIAEAQYSCTLSSAGKWCYSKSDAEKWFDNSKKNNRFSGQPVGAPVADPQAQSSLYLATQGTNGLYGGIAPERSFYADKEKHREILAKLEAGTATKDELLEHFGVPRMAPADRVFLVFTLPQVPVLDMDGYNPVLNEALSDVRAEATEVLRQIMVDAPWALPQVLGPKGIAALGLLGPRASLSAEILATQMSDYSDLVKGGPSQSGVVDYYGFSQALGNTLLEGGQSLTWSSRHEEVIPQQAYLAGSAAIVVPKTSPRVLESVIFFDQASKRPVRLPAIDGIELKMPPDASS